MKHRFFLCALLLAALLGTGLILPAGATPTHDEVLPDAEFAVKLQDFEIAAGFIRQYGGDLWINVRLRPEPLILDDAEASEWSVELWTGADCDGSLVTEMFGSDTRVYGPRVYGLAEGVTLDDVGSVLLVHDGPSHFGHSDTPGRHELVCIPSSRRPPAGSTPTLLQ
ncbi:hypothetical protein BH24ACT1_BH24ACT1_07310 [soil metagenome]